MLNLEYNIIKDYNDIANDVFDFFETHEADFCPPLSTRAATVREYILSVFDFDWRIATCHHNGKLIGAMGINLNHSRWKHYYQLIAIEYEYRRDGIAQVLVDMCNKLLIENGVQRVIARTSSPNIASQNLLLKNGFIHFDTLLNDKGPGLHSYFYSKCFKNKEQLNGTDISLQLNINPFTFSNITQTIAKIPRLVKEPLSVNVTVCTAISSLQATTQKNETISVHLHEVVKKISFLVDDKKKWLVVTDVAAPLADEVKKKNYVFADETLQQKIQASFTEIRRGTEVVFYANDFIQFAKSNNCNGLLLIAPELHGMFKFERMQDDVEIFDVLLEFIFLTKSH
jgi:RimJ/RimL family protein N-acetyltransferase